MAKGEALLKVLREGIEDVVDAFAAKRAPRPRQKPKIRVDNPGGKWLEAEQRRARENKYWGSETARVRKPIKLDPAKIRDIRGANNEVRVPGESQYDALRPSVEKHGLYEDSPILIGVNQFGEPRIIEGNTRTAVANDLGLPEIPAEIVWYAGGEQVSDAMLRPDNIEEFMAQSELMRDPNFRRYFEGSKLVDQYGEPLRLYHATPENFSEFKPGGINPDISGSAIWLGSNAEHQPAFHRIGSRTADFKEGTNVMPVYARMRNPLLIDDKTMSDWATDVFAGGNRNFPQLMPQHWVDNIRSAGYDGIIYKQPPLVTPSGEKRYSDEYIVFDPTQIKSAIGNRGSFDPMDPDITKAKGGLAVKPIWEKKRPKDLGKPKSLSVKKKKSAKARAAAAGRPYPNLVDNLAVARKKGK